MTSSTYQAARGHLLRQANQHPIRHGNPAAAPRPLASCGAILH